MPIEAETGKKRRIEQTDDEAKQSKPNIHKP
jgi:hypothetical protein